MRGKSPVETRTPTCDRPSRPTFPSQKFDVILFRECLFYVAQWRMRSVLSRYADYLTSDGVLIVRLYDAIAYRGIVRLIETNFEVVDKHVDSDDEIVITFRKKR